MSTSKDAKVQGFLDGMRDLDFEKYEILQQVRSIVFGAVPDVEERFIYGGIMFRQGDGDFGGIFASKKHISFEFTQGYKFNDPDKMLEGTGKFRRHLKLRLVGDVAAKDAAGFVNQALAQV